MIVLHRRGVVDEFRSGMVFKRGSLAWDARGRQYGVNQARFETVGARRGIRIEEATTNLVPNPSFERDSNGDGTADHWSVWVRGTGDATRIHEVTLVPSWIGNGKAQRVLIVAASDTTQQTSLQSSQFNVTEGLTYTARARVRSSVPNKVRICFRWEDATGKLLTQSYSNYLSSVTGDELSVTASAPALAAKATVQIEGITQAGEWLEADAVMVEQKAFATTYADSTRAAEFLTVPTAGILSPAEGTISLWVYVDSVARRLGSGSTRIFHVHGNPGYLILFHRNDENNWTFESWNGTAYRSVTIPDSHTPDGWHLFTATWSMAEGLKLYIDGALKGSNADHSIPTEFSSKCDIGQANGSFYLNTLFADLHISSIARSDEEILADFQRGYHVPDQYTTFYHPLDGPDSQRAARSVVV